MKPGSVFGTGKLQDGCFCPGRDACILIRKIEMKKSKRTHKIISGDAKYSKRNKASRLLREGSSMLKSHGPHGGMEGGKRPVQGVGV